MLYALQTLAYGVFLLLCAGACVAVMAAFDRIAAKLILGVICFAGLGALMLLLGLWQLAMALFFHGSVRSRVISALVALGLVATGAAATPVLLRGRSLPAADLASIVDCKTDSFRAWLVMGQLGFRREHEYYGRWEWPEKGITIFSDYGIVESVVLAVVADASCEAYQGELPFQLAAGDRAEQIATKLGPLPECSEHLSTEHDKIYEYRAEGIQLRLCEGELKCVILSKKQALANGPS